MPPPDISGVPRHLSNATRSPQADVSKIALKGASKRFDARGGGILALQSINLTVSEQEFVALVGPSGCGKSTVLYLVAGLMAPSEGSITYNGKHVGGPNLNVGYITQKDTILPWRSVADNIGIALELRCRSVSSAERRDRITQMIELVGLKGFDRHYP